MEGWKVLLAVGFAALSCLFFSLRGQCHLLFHISLLSTHYSRPMQFFIIFILFLHQSVTTPETPDDSKLVIVVDPTTGTIVEDAVPHSLSAVIDGRENVNVEQQQTAAAAAVVEPVPVPVPVN